MPVQLGLCCQTIGLRYDKKEVTGSRSIALKTIEKKGLREAITRAKKNIEDLGVMMKWIRERGIKVFRLPSDMIPHGSNLVLIEKYGDMGKNYLKLTPFIEDLKKLGEIGRSLGLRLTFHPGQYNQLGSVDKGVIKRTAVELLMHCRILEIMGVDRNGVVVLHGGGTYGDIKETSKRIIERIKWFPDIIRKRLVLENDEKCYSPDDLLPICLDSGCPLVFDIHHYHCYEKNHPGVQRSIQEMLPDIVETWKKRDIRIKFHISEQNLEKRLGAHSFFVETIPGCLWDLAEKEDYDLMIEAKGKELSIGRLYQKYPNLVVEDCKNIKMEIPKKGMKDFGKYSPIL